MEALKLLEKPEEIAREYDEATNAPYLSVDKRRPALGIDINEGVVLRYDEAKGEVVRLTLLGLRERLLQNLPHTPNGLSSTRYSL